MSVTSIGVAGAAGTRRMPAYRGYVLGLLVAVGVCGWIDRNILAVVLESIKADLDLSDTHLGLLGGAVLGCLTMALLQTS